MAHPSKKPGARVIEEPEGQSTALPTQLQVGGRVTCKKNTAEHPGQRGPAGLGGPGGSCLINKQFKRTVRKIFLVFLIKKKTLRRSLILI